MNIAVIFAGGHGTRLSTSDIPKQFMEYDGKPIIIHTLEHFQKHEQIDSIIIVCLNSWIDKCWEYVHKFEIGKVSAIVSGGETGQESIYNGLKKASVLFPQDSTVLINDGVRPLIDGKLISQCIESVQNYRSAIVSTPSTETVLVNEKNGNIKFVDRSLCRTAKAPQCFVLKDILESHEKAKQENLSFIDSSMLMAHYGCKLHLVEGTSDNIKITTMADYYSFCALYDLRKGTNHEN